METLWLLAALLAPLALREAALRIDRRRSRSVWLQLPEELAVETQPAYKAGQIYVDDTASRAVLVGVSVGEPYAVEATATCPARGCEPPGLDCACGFYAYRDTADAVALLRPAQRPGDHPASMLLHVELAGRLLEYELGFRAEIQRILRVDVPAWCHECRRLGQWTKATSMCGHPSYRVDGPLRPAGKAYRRLASGGWMPLRAVCDDHVPHRDPEPVRVGVDRLTGLLGTEVRVRT